MVDSVLNLPSQDFEIDKRTGLLFFLPIFFFRLSLKRYFSVFQPKLYIAAQPSTHH
jgi:hypothetical protein